MEHNIRVIQTSKPRTGSTVLTNLVHGFLSPTKPVAPTNNIIDNMITKQHDLDFQKLLSNKDYNIYLVVSLRNEKQNDYLKNSKILYINYNEILMTESNTVEKICNDMYIKFNNFFPDKIKLNLSREEIISNMINRFENMNKKVEELKNKPFSYWDSFYGVHGSHRNRD